MESSVIIIIAAHKEYRMPEDSMYLPVHVGAAGKDSIGYQRDDEGENISELNLFFCELTGVYWAWKNLEADYIGLAHYRRHFSMYPHAKDKWTAVLKKEEIESELGKIKVFVPGKRRYFIETLYSHYAHTHYASQLDETQSIIRENCPQYADCFEKVMNQRWGYMFNMMIMEHGLFDSYCTWLFEILFKLRDRLGEKDLSAFQARYYGRVSELLFNVWLTEKIESGEINKDQIKEIPCIHMESINWLKKGTAFVMAKFKGKKYEKGF